MSIRSRLEPLALTLLRISTGIIMAAHGWDKLQNLNATVEQFGAMGIPKAGVYLAIAGELGGGLGLIVGLLTPVAAFGVFCTMAVAVLHVHLKNGLFAKDGGFEYPLTLAMVALYFIMRGAGPVSLDGIFCKKKEAA
ncbi:DoxX family protein [Deltaproteobacteria bacterium PRO3]|nr:DoxX family protein [Deltaproteobacteria bacterium PRO3]